MSQPPELVEPEEARARPPAHGYQGDRGAPPAAPPGPAGASLAVSREAGARGGTIARRVARLLG